MERGINCAVCEMNNTTTTNTTCSTLLYIAPEDVCEVATRLSDFAAYYTSQNYANISEVVKNTSTNDSRVYSLPSIELDISDTRSEKIHTFDSAALLLIMALLFLAVITIWVFKAKRLRVFHETGLSLIYGESWNRATCMYELVRFLIKAHHWVINAYCLSAITVRETVLSTC